MEDVAETLRTQRTGLSLQGGHYMRPELGLENRLHFSEAQALIIGCQEGVPWWVGVSRDIPVEVSEGPHRDPTYQLLVPFWGV